MDYAGAITATLGHNAATTGGTFVSRYFQATARLLNATSYSSARSRERRGNGQQETIMGVYLSDMECFFREQYARRLSGLGW